MSGISVLILTRNEEQDLPGCLRSLAWSDDIHVYDSMSSDRTVEIAQQRAIAVRDLGDPHLRIHDRVAVTDMFEPEQVSDLMERRPALHIRR